MAPLIKAALHAQMAARLREDIADGVYNPGDALPSESALCKIYDVSPTTVRKALMTLRTEGLIEAHQGKGSFVRHGHAAPPAVVERRPDVRHRLIPTGEADRRADVPADAATAARLEVETGAPLFTAEWTARDQDSGRTVLIRTVLPYATAASTPLADDPFGDTADLPTALAGIFGPLATSEYVRAVMPTPEQSTVLGQADIGPVIETTTVTTAGQRALYAVTERRSAEGIMLRYPL
jgi:GntR family transcriptional regulator